MILHWVVRFAAVAWFAAAACDYAIAHQQKAAITNVSYNPRSDSIEVVHRFYIHDAEHAMQLLHDPKASIVSDENVQKVFADYVADQFSLRLESGEELELDLIGYELERAFIYVYQESPGRLGTNSIRLSFSALHDIWPDQSNMVNVEIGDCLETVVFDGRIREVEVRTSGDKCY